MLPSTAPLDHPHLIDHTSFNEYTLTKDLRLCDGVATTLWNFDQDAFTKFFDKNTNTFEWRNIAWKKDTGKRSSFCSLIIRRQGSEVVVSQRPFLPPPPSPLPLPIFHIH